MCAGLSDGKLDFEEFKEMIGNTDIARQLTLEVRVSSILRGCLVPHNVLQLPHRTSFDDECSSTLTTRPPRRMKKQRTGHVYYYYNVGLLPLLKRNAASGFTRAPTLTGLFALLLDATVEIPLLSTRLSRLAVRALV